MIAKVLVSSKPPTVGLRPVGDSLPGNGPLHPPRVWPHRYPTEGCHGAPLERECPCAKPDGTRAFIVPEWCEVCNGTGRVRVDHPNRTDGP